MVIGAVSTYPAEALIEALMSDDRVGRRPQHYIDVVSEEIASFGKVSHKKHRKHKKQTQETQTSQETQWTHETQEAQ